MWALCPGNSPAIRELESNTFTLMVTPVLGQRGHFKILAAFTLKPVLLSEDDAADDNPESQEMLEEQLVRLLTREVMDLISK